MLASGSILLLVTVGIGLGLILTRIARGIAESIGMLDAPDGHRKTHDRPIPVAGGIAVLAAAILTLIISAYLEPAIADTLLAHKRQAIALLIAGLIITTVGVADDRYNLRARFKLLGQFAAILVLVSWGGIRFERISLFGQMLELGLLAIPCTILWLLACINALNLIDGMDGLLGTIGSIALITLAIVAAISGHTFAAIIATALACSIIGFLWWNLPPATIYMGDAGSMLIGLVIGAVAIPASLKGPATVALGAPLAILILPMFDTTAAIIRRKLTGRGLATGDRGHLHHVMQRNGLTRGRVLVVVAVLGTVAAMGALASTALHNDLFAVIAALGVVFALIAGKLFGNAELRLIQRKFSSSLRKFFPGRPAPQPWQLAVRLQGNGNWDQVWEDLTGIAERMNLQTICLDVNAPWIHENYHARWDCPKQVHESYLYRLELPLFSGSMSIGRLSVAARRDESQPLTDTLVTLSKILELAEVHATELTPRYPTPVTPIPPTLAKPVVPARA